MAPHAGSTRVEASGPSASHEVIRLQRRLAVRMLLIFAVPLVVIGVLTVYAYSLSTRLKEVEALEQISFIERSYRDSRNVTWAIDQYTRLATQHRRPTVLVRLANLYFERARRSDSTAPTFYGQDVALAIDTLNEANTLHEKAGRGEYWEAYTTLTAVYTALAEQETEPARKRELEMAAIRAGEAALKLNRFDGDTHNNVAWILATSASEDVRDLPRAEQLAGRAVEYTQRRNRQYLDTLAEVYRRAEQSKLAGDVFREALQKEPGGKDPYLEGRKQLFDPALAGGRRTGS